MSQVTPKEKKKKDNRGAYKIIYMKLPPLTSNMMTDTS